MLQVATPEGLTALNLDIIRLTAQMVARNGKKFMRCKTLVHTRL